MDNRRGISETVLWWAAKQLQSLIDRLKIAIYTVTLSIG